MTEDPDDAVAVLRRWELSGGRWRVLARTGSAVTVGLFSCDGGEEMDRVTSSGVALTAYLCGRARSDE